ncbi:MAG: hypothetical protein MJ136_00770 [Clostridia bacterium]|nr:hypothetical protein [Clostridia bacterium]
MKKLIAVMMTLVMLLCSVSAMAEMAGGWMIPENTELTEEALAAFKGAVGENAEMNPELVLGTQVVAGVNYAILASAPAGIEIVYVYHSVSGEDQLLREQLVLPMGEGMMGAWQQFTDEESVEIAAQQITAAMEGLTGIGLTECYLLGQQVVNGTNYAVLGRKVTVTAEPVEGWVLMTVNVDLEGHAVINDIQDIVLSASAD